MYGTLTNTFISLRNTYLIGAVRGWWEIEQERTALNDWTQSALTLLTRTESEGDTVKGLPLATY